MDPRALRQRRAALLPRRSGDPAEVAATLGCAASTRVQARLSPARTDAPRGAPHHEAGHHETGHGHDTHPAEARRDRGQRGRGQRGPHGPNGAGTNGSGEGRKPPGRSARLKPPASLTVTLAYADREWTVAANLGTKVLAKPYGIKPAEALRMVSLLDVPGVHDAVESIIAAERVEAEDRARRLREELADIETRLAELTGRGLSGSHVGPAPSGRRRGTIGAPWMPTPSAMAAAAVLAVRAGPGPRRPPAVCRLRVTGDVPDDYRDGPLILAGNHIGTFDPVMLHRRRPDRRLAPRMMATGGLFRAPIVGPFMRAAGHIPVDRGRATVANAVPDAVEALRAGSVVFIYPEGRIGLDPGDVAGAGQERPGPAGPGHRARRSCRSRTWGSHEVDRLPRQWPTWSVPSISAFWRRPTVRIHFGAPVDLSDLREGVTRRRPAGQRPDHGRDRRRPGAPAVREDGGPAELAPAALP